MKLIELAIEAILQSLVAGAFLVDVIPICEPKDAHNRPHFYLNGYISSVRYIPSWFPGAGFQHKAASWKRSVITAREKPYSVVKDRMVGRINNSALCTNVIGFADSWRGARMRGQGSDRGGRVEAGLMSFRGRHQIRARDYVRRYVTHIWSLSFLTLPIPSWN